MAYYNKGKQFPELVSSNVLTSIDSVLFPAIAMKQDDPGAVKQMVRRFIKSATYIMMPVMNGLETTSAIRKIEGHKSQIPVIALTAHDPADFFSEFSACGFNELITKPYLITKIQKLVNDFCK